MRIARREKDSLLQAVRVFVELLLAILNPRPESGNRHKPNSFRFDGGPFLGGLFP